MSTKRNKSERAAQAAIDSMPCPWRIGAAEETHLVAAIAAAIDKAVEAERRACLRATANAGGWLDCRDAIRARKGAR